MLKGVLLDLSGVLYTGDSAIDGAHAALQRLHDAGLPVRYITNTTRKTAAAILQQLHDMQFEINSDELFTAPQAASLYLQENALNAVFLVHPNIESEFSTDAARPVNAVMVGDAAEGFCYENLNRAFRYLLDGAGLYAMGINRYFREQQGFSLDAGPFVRALEYANDCKATVIGKPAAEFYRTAVASLGCNVSETVMVGDDVESDVIGAVNAGLQAILVRTGKYQPGDETRLDGQANCVDDITAAVSTLIDK